jgi:hypothetical protein
MKFGLIGMVAVAILGLITFGTIAAINGNGINNNGDYDSFYKYEISLVDRYVFDDDTKASTKEVGDFPESYDPMGQQDYIEAVEQVDDKLVQEVEFITGTDVFDVEIVKNEENVAFRYMTPEGN